MRIRVHVSPNAKRALVEQVSDDVYRVKVNAKPLDGAANIRLIEILAEHFNIPFGSVRIASGATSREKIIEILM